MSEVMNNNPGNPYAAPRAEVADVYDGDDDVQPVKLFSAKGRIGRLRYWGYLLTLYLLCLVLAGILGGIAGYTGHMAMSSVLGVVAMVPYFIGIVLLSIQRSHDMDWSGWSALLALIPFVALVWIFKRGTDGRNRFGAPPPPNPLLVKIVAWIVPLVAVIGIVSAIALPAYQSYTQRAKAAQIVKP